MRAFIFPLLLLSALLAVNAYGQGGATGAISGTVEDQSSAVVPKAQIDISGVAGTIRHVESDAHGEFTAPLLPVGTYTITISAPGFAETRFSEVEVRVTETTRLTAVLRPRSIATQVDVQAQVANVETTTAVTGQSLTAQTIGTLPLATQNFQQLLALSAGTASNLNASASLGRGDTRIDVNGQREDNNNYQIEGITASDYNVAELTNTPLPSPDVVAEFKVQTSLYDASQGRNGGGNINAVLKSGTNNIHGDVFEFFRNDDLNANEFFLNSQGHPRPTVKQNIFGGSLGGPVLPKGKLGYFFLNYQGTRQLSGLSSGTIIGTSLPVLPLDRSAASLAATFFPGNPSVSAASIDPVALKLLSLQGTQFGTSPGGYLIPTVAGTPGSTAQFHVSRAGKYNDDQFTTNYDKELGPKDKISGRFFFSDFESLLPFGAGGLQASFGGSISPSDLNFPYDLPVRDRFLNVTETHTFSPHWVNEFRFGFVHIDSGDINTPIVTANQLGIDRPNNNVDNLIYKFTFNSSGFQIGPTPAADITQLQNNYVFLNTTSWTNGKHLIRFGGEFDRVNLDKNFPQVFNGQLFFSPGFTPSGPCALGCSDFQEFLLGAPSFSYGGSGMSNHEYRINDFAGFLQDDYKVTPDFTLNLGVRWELNGAVRDDLCHIGNTFAILANEGINPYVYPTCVNKLNVPGLVGTRNATTLNNEYASDWGPRFGFAYNLFGRSTTALRGGYGIYYVREDVGAVDQLSFQAPFLPIPSTVGTPGQMATIFATGIGRLPVGGVIDPSFVPVYSRLIGFVDANGNPTNDTTQTPVYTGNTVNILGLEVPPHYVNPSTQQWNLTLQQSLGGGWMMELGYVGTKGTHLRDTRNIDQAYDARVNPVTLTAIDGKTYTITQNSLANINARGHYLGLDVAGFQVFADDANSIYNAFEATLYHRFSHGLHLQAAYTWSRAIDETSTGNTSLNSAVNNQLTLQDSRGLADFDRAHRVVVNYTWELPFFAKSKGIVHAALGGWFLSGITTFQSGAPFTVLDSAAASAFGLLGTGTPTTPDLILGIDPLTHGSTESRLNGYVNLNAFRPAPVVGVDGSTGFGDLGRNTFRGPFQQNWDFSAGKSFAITESQRLRVTADFFNLFNHPNFANPAFLDIESPSNFGQITSTVGTPRLIQFSAKYSF
ncbi:MAG: TonB-dependent receptor [Acidobacteriaceae bacterium]|nr:TonB-dependent receptor [Acidobacteriaceae bacterium]MBV9779704.1 TonB-dependent receptor [Acidobacteriaceae bacterium]